MLSKSDIIITLTSIITWQYQGDGLRTRFKNVRYLPTQPRTHPLGLSQLKLVVCMLVTYN